MIDTNFIDPNGKYKPMKVAELQLITGKTKNNWSNYLSILRLIKSGRLKAIDISTGKKKPTYYITGEEVIHFLKERGEYED